MIKSIKVSDERLMLKEIKFCSTLNLLYGCNGIGKSSLLRTIRDRFELKKFDRMEVSEDVLERAKVQKDEDLQKFFISSSVNEYGLHTYFDSSDNLGTNHPAMNADIDAMVRHFNVKFISEGESIVESFLEFIEKNKSKFEEGNTILIDEIDSGLSVEYINMILNVIIDIINKHKVQFIIGINNYHWIYRVKQYIDMSTGKFVECNSYDEFMKNTLAVRDKKMKFEEKQRKKEEATKKKSYKE